MKLKIETISKRWAPRIIAFLFVLVILSFAGVVLAQGGPRGDETSLIVSGIGRIVTQLIPVVVGVALLVFIWGLVKFIVNAGSEDGRKEGKQIMLWGIISLFVIVSIWGIVRFISIELLATPQPDQFGRPPLIQGLPSSGGSSGPSGGPFPGGTR